MQVKLVGENDTSWGQLAHDIGGAFVQKEWLNCFGDRIIKVGIYQKDNSLIGGFVLSKSSVVGIPFYALPSFISNNGLFLKCKAKNRTAIHKLEKNVSTVLADFFKTIWGIKTIAFPTQWNDFQPFIWSNFKVIPSYTYQLNLSTSIDEIVADFSSESRNLMRKAEKDGIHLVEVKNDNKDQVKSLLNNTFSSKKARVNASLLENILLNGITPENSFGYIAYNNKTPIATVICIYHNGISYNVMSGMDRNNAHGGAGILCMKACIEKAKSLNIEIFDFEGSMLPTVEKYYRGFGGDLIPFYSINKAPILIEMALKLVKRNLF